MSEFTFLKDKVVLVTGSTRGIGHAICDAFAREGAKTICTGTKQDSCDQVSQEFQDNPSPTGNLCNIMLTT